MSRWTASWRVAARIARRDAVRSRGRTALVAAMIGVPVLVGAGGGTLIQSQYPSAERKVEWNLGGHAQATVSGYYVAGLSQTADEATGFPGDFVDPPPLGEYEASLAALVPDGDRLVRVSTGIGQVSTDERIGQRAANLREVPAADMADAVVPPLTSGALPAAAGEVAISEQVAERLAIGVGDEITVQPMVDGVLVQGAAIGAGGPVTAHVSGVLRDWPVPVDVLAPEGALLPAVGPDCTVNCSASWVVLGDVPVSWDTVRAVNALGSVVQSRTVMLDPPAAARPPSFWRGFSANAGAFAIVGAIGAVALLEAVLIIGPAFAVGQGRSRRQLALLAATGGDRRDVRRAVLATGVVIGAASSALAAAGGIAIGAVVRWFAVRDDPFGMPDLRVPWWAVPVLVVLGALVGAAACALPARRATRMDVVAALAGRRAEARPRRAVPIAGVVLAGAGLAVALAGAVTGAPFLLVGGVVALELGIVLAAGGVVSLLGLLAPHLRTAGRFAVRDAVRQRARTAPALAAIVAAMAGAAAGVVYLDSAQAQGEANYQQVGALGTVSVSASYAPGASAPEPDDVTTAEEVLRERLPVADLAPVSVAVPVEPEELEPAAGIVTSSDGAVVATGGYVIGGTTDVRLVRAPEQECPSAPADGQTLDLRCWSPAGWKLPWIAPTVLAHTYVVDDGTAVALLHLPGSDEAARALAAGKVVVASPYDLWPDGTAHVEVQDLGATTTADGVPAPLAAASIPAVVVDLGNREQLEAILPPSALAALGLTTRTAGFVVTTTREPSQEELDAAQAGLDPAVWGDVGEERGPVHSLGRTVWIVVLAALVVGVLATWIAVALAAAESRPDLATMSAVGAAPRVRRRIAAAQAAVLSLTGAVLGGLTGVLLGRVLVAARRYSGQYDDPTWVTTIPWPALAAVVVGIPALTVGAAWLFTRSRLPMVRRIVG